MSPLLRRSCRISRAVLYIAILGFSATSTQADPVSRPGCDTAAVTAQVLEQFAVYGPRSRKQEYFGFVYSLDGALASAVVRGNACRGHDSCKVEIKSAAKLIPPRAKVLGEWHTHPHVLGAGMLSSVDVRGAGRNAHIRCYASYYAASNGRVYSWNPRSTSVPTAMASRTELGSYWDAINFDSFVRFASARGGAVTSAGAASHSRS